MSIDFNNRATAGSTDPNAVVSVQPSQNTAWIKTAPDGSWQGNIVINDTNPGPGYRSVGYATVTLNDGRQFRAVLDGQGQPISEVGDQVGVDDKQHSAFVQQGNAATPNSGAQYQRGADGNIYQWDPNGNGTGRGGYTIPRPDLNGANAGPPGGKPYIDDGAETGQSGRRWGWDQNAFGPGRGGYTRDLGPSPAAQLPTTASDKKPVDGHPGIFIVTTKDAKTNQTETHYEDASGTTVPAPPEFKPGTLVDDGHGGKVMVTQDPATGAVKTQPVTGVQGKPDQVTANGVVYERGSDGTYAPAKGLPTSRPGQMVVIDGRNFWAAPNADPSQPPTLTPMNPGAGTQPADNGPQFEPGMSSSDYLKARQQYWMAQRKAGVSQADINAGWSQDVQIATSRQNDQSTAASQENQRLSSAMSGFNDATSKVADLNRYLPPGSDLGGKALEAMLGLQLGQAQRMGGYGPPATGAVPTASPPAAGPAPSSQVAAIPPPPAAASAPPPLLPPPPAATAPIPGVHMLTPPARTAPSSAPAAAASPVAASAPAPDMRNSSDMDLPPGTPPAATSGTPDIAALRVLPPAPSGVLTFVAPDGTMYQQIRGTLQRVGQDPTAWGQATPPTPGFAYPGDTQAGPVAPTDATGPGAAEPGMTPGGNLPAFDPHAVVTTPAPGATVYDPVTNPGADDSAPPAPGYGQPGMTVLPQPQGMAPTPELPVIAAARIAATPPWKLDEASYRQAQAMGIEPDFWRVPTLGSVGA